ncbi:hypothetical protein VNI00_011671 [Paramarasmius palmivorus]|uniref:Microbial-type PARG catalytic domain-containing protein n=1 Tax=Paramarasmius palmivorus TaxID=297713 RepID=A0AAW0CEN8_9AGAR
MSVSDFFKPKANPRSPRVKIAEQTLEAIEKGSYTLNGNTHPLNIETLERSTRYYAPDSMLSNWRQKPKDSPTKDTTISIIEMTTLEGARYLSQNMTSQPQSSPAPSRNTIGVLNFASAKKPGGGFLTGAQAQEESIARSSTLYPSLMTNIAQTFYSHHLKDKKNFYYTHAMIYSSNVVVFRDDDGNWVEPLSIDVLTSAAVNAGEVRKNAEADPEEKIEKEMKERMARVLYLFEMRGTKNLVLGSFGTGVFQNKVPLIASIWAELLSTRYQHSFDHVAFAIIGRKTFEEFRDTFNSHHSSQTVQS